MVRPVWLAISLLVLGAGFAQAQGGDDAARRAIEAARDHMERGQELYLQARYLEAAEEFQRAFEAQPFGAFLYNAAVAYERQDDLPRAAEFFERYLAAEPRANDAADVRTRIARLRAEVERRAAALAAAAAPPEGTPPEGTPPEGTPPEGTPPEGTPPEGTPPAAPPSTPERELAEEGHAPVETTPEEMKSLLTIRTDPVGARVTVKQAGTSVAAGESPFVQTLEQGDYQIVVEHPDYRTVEERVRVRAGKVYVVIVEMSQGQFLGYLRVVSDVPGAAVYIDDRAQGAMGQTPFANALSTGPHRVWVERPGYRLEEHEVEVGPGEDVTLRVALTRVDFGRIQVTANVRGAAVFVDDREVGRVPYSGELSAGPHRIRVSADDMKDWEQQVEIRNGQLTPIRVRLRPEMGRSGAWVTSTLAAVVLGGGITLGVMSNRAETELRGELDAGTLTSNDDRLLRGKILSIAADVGFGLAGVLALVATYQFLRDPLPDSEARVLEPRDWALAPGVGPDGVGLTLHGSF